MGSGAPKPKSSGQAKSPGEKVAVLGPAGTYSESALLAFRPHSTPHLCSNITEAFRAVAAGSAAQAFVPLENLLQGPVSETLDALLEYRGEIFIESSYVAQIRHAIGMLECGTVKKIYSHEQPLSQCARYLRTHHPDAELCPVESTATAIEKVRSSADKNAAVIASGLSLKSAGFTLLGEDIADNPNNRTRFVLLRAGNIDSIVAASPPTRNEILRDATTSLVICPGKDRQGLLYEMLEIISVRNHLNMISIHSRPDLKGGFIFFLDLEGHVDDRPVRTCIEELREYCRNMTGCTTEVSIFGSYLREAFFHLPFKTIAIVGGKGIMGRWFEQFFQQAGFEAIIFDHDATETLEALVKRAEVLMLSIPMSEMPAFCDRLSPLLSPGKLIVENCSIKSSSLPLLKARVPTNVEILGIHTMFGGDIPSVRGQNVVVTTTDSSGPLSQGVIDLFYKYGARITYATIDDHDRRTAFVQSLVQLVLIGLADVLRLSFSTPQAIEAFSTPNSRAILSAMARTVSQTDGLLVDLQLLNNQSPEIRSRYLETVNRFVMELNLGDTTSLLESVRLCREFLGEPADPAQRQR